MIALRIARVRPDHGRDHARLASVEPARGRSASQPATSRSRWTTGAHSRRGTGDVLLIRQLLFNKGITQTGDRPFGHRLHLYRIAFTPVQRDVFPPEGQDRRLGLSSLPRVLQARSRRRNGSLRQRAGLGLRHAAGPRATARALGLPPERLIQRVDTGEGPRLRGGQVLLLPSGKRPKRGEHGPHAKRRGPSTVVLRP